jgi:transcriptional regulator with XRE-family HTH domain
MGRDVPTLGRVSEQEPARYAARLRAARAYARISKADMAARLAISVRQLGRLEAGEADVPYELRQRIATVATVPDWFLEHGFDAEYVEPPLAEKVEAALSRLSTIEKLSAQRWGEAMRLHDELLERVNQAHERITHNDERILRLTSGSLGEPANGTHGLREAADLLDDAAQQANTPPDESGEEPPADSQEG